MTAEPVEPFFRLDTVGDGAGVAVGGRVRTGTVTTGGVVMVANGFGVTVASQPSQLVDTGVGVTGAMVGVGVPAGGIVWNAMVLLWLLSVRPLSVISSDGT